jgi:CHAT domain-containing protein/tetratricopeptide (TPR) repeat protein
MPSDSPLTNLSLLPEVLRETDPDPQRLLLWLKGDRRDRFQHWERISGHILASGDAGKGLAAVPVRVTPFRQRVGAELARLFGRFWGGKGKPDAGYILPTGDWAERSGQPREDALLVWASETAERDEPAAIDEVWPTRETCKRLGPRLFLVMGVPAPSAAPSQVASSNGNGSVRASAPSADFVALVDEEPKTLVASPPVARAGAEAPTLSDHDVQQWLQRMSRQVTRYCDASRWTQATELAQQVLSWIRKLRGEQHPQVAACLNQAARVYQLRGDLPSAEPFYREALRMNGEILGIGHPSFATGLNNLALLHQDLGKRAAAEELHRQALEIRLASLGERHPLVATSRNNLGLMHLGAGHPQAAEPLIADAVESLRDSLGPEHPDLAICIHNLAAVYRALGDAERAATLAHQAQTIRDVSCGRDYLRIGESLTILAEYRSEPAEDTPPVPVDAREPVVVEEPIPLELVPDDDVATAEQPRLHALEAEALPAAADAAPAVPDDAGLEIQAPVELWEPEATDDEAISIPEEPCAIPSESAKTDPDFEFQPAFFELSECGERETGEARIDEDELCWASAELAELLPAEVIEEALPAEVIDEPGSAAADVGHYQDDVVPAATLEPESLPADAEIVEEAVPTAPVSADPGPSEEDVDYWADLDVHSEEPDEIAPVAEFVAVATSEPQAEHGDSPVLDVHSEEPNEVAPVAEIVPVATSEPQAEHVVLPAADSVSAPADLVRQADQYRAVLDFRTAEDLYRRALATRHSDWDSSQPYFVQLAHALNGLAVTCAATGRASEALKLLRKVVAVDGALLADALSPGGEDRRSIRLHWLRTDLHAILSLVVQFLVDSPEAVRTALDVVLRYQGIDPEAWTDIGTARAKLAEQVHSGTRREVARALPSESALVEFVRLPIFDFQAASTIPEDSRRQARYLAFVLRAGEPDNVHLLDLGAANAIDEKIAAFRAAITDEGEAPRLPRRVTAPHLSPVPLDLSPGLELRRALFDPLSEALAGRTRLIMAPTGNLVCLPFDVLPTDEDGYLLDTYQISYVGSGRDVLGFGRRGEGQPSAPMVAGDPDFDLGLPGVPQIRGISAPTPPAWRVSPSAADSPPLFPRLPGTRRSAKAVAELLEVEPFLAGSVRKSQIQALHSPWVLHLATHCYFSKDEPDRSAAAPAEHEIPDAPADSGLALAGANRHGHGQVLPALGEQGLLTVADVGALDLAATALVVLPACASGPGTGKLGDKLLGLRRAFARAGARALVMSQWKVSDWHAKVLLVDFYNRVLDGEPRAEALRSAQLALRAQYPNQPASWGGFVCHGDPGPLQEPLKTAQNR